MSVLHSDCAIVAIRSIRSLRAQFECRITLQTLHAFRSPSVVCARPHTLVNISHSPENNSSTCNVTISSRFRFTVSLITTVVVISGNTGGGHATWTFSVRGGIRTHAAELALTLAIIICTCICANVRRHDDAADKPNT